MCAVCDLHKLAGSVPVCVCVCVRSVCENLYINGCSGLQHETSYVMCVRQGV